MRYAQVGLAILATGVLSACGSQTFPVPAPTETLGSGEQTPLGQSDGTGLQDGPKVDPNRELEPITVSKSEEEQFTTSRVEFGTAEVGAFRAPIRGVLIRPDQADKPAPLIVVNHLRAPNCVDDTFALPCPEGVEEVRADDGMSYYGEALAAKGYAVLIPDLSGAWLGVDLKEPYDQEAMWEQTITAFIDRIKSDHSGATQNFGVDLANKIDLNSIGLVLYSRSGQILNRAADTFGAGRIKGVFAYAPSYDTFGEGEFSPAPEDVPYLALVGEQDLDVGSSANLWVSEYLFGKRTQPLLAVSTPGLGHMYVNRAFSSRNKDDRTACDIVLCPDAKAHEQALIELSSAWFDQTVKGQEGLVPTSPHLELPQQLGDLPLRWLAATHGEGVVHLTPDQFAETEPGSAKVCERVDPMIPKQVEHPCPDPELGVIETASKLVHFTKAQTQTDIAGAKVMAIHALPFGSLPNPGGGASLTVTLQTASGQAFSHMIPADSPVLMNRLSAQENGVYRVGTVRIPLPEWVTNTTITGISLQTGDLPVELRGIDFSK